MKTGTHTGAIETSAKWRRRQAAKRRAEEAEWKAKSGPVIVKFVKDSFNATPAQNVATMKVLTGELARRAAKKVAPSDPPGTL